MAEPPALPVDPDAAPMRHSLFADQVGEGLGNDFPFETVLSFAPLIAHWEAMREREPATYAAAWTEIARDLAAAPELTFRVEAGEKTFGGH